jgi:hypothetical protein
VNRSKAWKAVQASFPGYDPLESLAALANDEKNPVAIRLRANTDLAKYLHVPLKARDSFADMDAPDFSDPQAGARTIEALIMRVAKKEMTPEQADKLSATIERYTRVVESTELLRRIEELERIVGPAQKKLF